MTRALPTVNVAGQVIPLAEGAGVGADYLVPEIGAQGIQTQTYRSAECGRYLLPAGHRGDDRGNEAVLDARAFLFRNGQP